MRSGFRFMLRIQHSRKHRAMIEAVAHNRPAMLQIGCGPHILPGWLNTDLRPGPQAVFLDASETFSFPDCYFDYAFSEHVIEHLNYETGARMVSEIFRILRPGGRVRIATPNLDFLVNLYLHPDEPGHQRYIRYSAERLALPAPATAVSIVNNFFRDWGHQYIHSRQGLEAMLLQSGFTSIIQCASGESPDPNLRSIDSHGLRIGDEFNRLETMVLEAVKPVKTPPATHVA